MLGQMEDAAPRKEISHEWVLIIGGVISIIFGVVLVANPAAGAPMLRAYFQYQWNDAWGWGAGSLPLLVDVPWDGRRQPGGGAGRATHGHPRLSRGIQTRGAGRQGFPERPARRARAALDVPVAASHLRARRAHRQVPAGHGPTGGRRRRRER